MVFESSAKTSLGCQFGSPGMVWQNIQKALRPPFPLDPSSWFLNRPWIYRPHKRPTSLCHQVHYQCSLIWWMLEFAQEFAQQDFQVSSACAILPWDISTCPQQQCGRRYRQFAISSVLRADSDVKVVWIFHKRYVSTSNAKFWLFSAKFWQIWKFSFGLGWLCQIDPFCHCYLDVEHLHGLQQS